MNQKEVTPVSQREIYVKIKRYISTREPKPFSCVGGDVGCEAVVSCQVSCYFPRGKVQHSTYFI